MPGPALKTSDKIKKRLVAAIVPIVKGNFKIPWMEPFSGKFSSLIDLGALTQTSFRWLGS